jgi:hypothetical protein
LKAVLLQIFKPLAKGILRPILETKNLIGLYDEEVPPPPLLMRDRKNDVKSEIYAIQE